MQTLMPHGKKQSRFKFHFCSIAFSFIIICTTAISANAAPPKYFPGIDTTYRFSKTFFTTRDLMRLSSYWWSHNAEELNNLLRQNNFAATTSKCDSKGSLYFSRSIPYTADRNINEIISVIKDSTGKDENDLIAYGTNNYNRFLKIKDSLITTFRLKKTDYKEDATEEYQTNMGDFVFLFTKDNFLCKETYIVYIMRFIDIAF